MQASEPRFCFALATDDWGLTVFPSIEAAVSYCEALDVELGAWLFFDSDGTSLRPCIDIPTTGRFIISHGKYHLERDPKGKVLQDEMLNVASVTGCGLTSLDDVLRLLRD